MNSSLLYEDTYYIYILLSLLPFFSDRAQYSLIISTPSLFNPAVFNIQAAQNRLSEALGGPNSLHSGSKFFWVVLPGARAKLMMD